MVKLVVFEDLVVLEDVRKVLEDFSVVFDCDFLDVELWRKIVCMVVFLKSSWISCYSLEVVIELDDDFVVDEVEFFLLVEGYVGEDFKD